MKAEALKKPAQISAQLKKDKANVDKLVEILRKHPPRESRLYEFYDVIKNLKYKGSVARNNGDKTGWLYYNEWANKLENEIDKVLGNKYKDVYGKVIIDMPDN